MNKPCDYCGRTDRNCENEAQMVACVLPEMNNEPSLRNGLAARIREAYAVGTSCTVCLSQPFARAILEALQEADRRAMQATIDGDMPCS